MKSCEMWHKRVVCVRIKKYIYLSLILQETEPKLSPSWNPKIICEPHPQFTEPVSSTTPFEPVQVGSLGGKIELSLTLKNNLAMPGAKVNKLVTQYREKRFLIIHSVL